MKRAKSRAIFTMIAVTVVGAASMFYPEWKAIVFDSGWYSLAFWIPLSVCMFWGGLAVCRLIFEAANRWITPSIIHMLERKRE